MCVWCVFWVGAYVPSSPSPCPSPNKKKRTEKHWHIFWGLWLLTKKHANFLRFIWLFLYYFPLLSITVLFFLSIIVSNSLKYKRKIQWLLQVFRSIYFSLLPFSVTFKHKNLHRDVVIFEGKKETRVKSAFFQKKQV